MLRVTSEMGLLTAKTDMQRIQYELNLRQRQATSGSRINQASDDAVGAAQLIRTDGDRREIDQCLDNISRSLGQLEAADAALDSATEISIRAREIAISMANSTVTAEVRASAATEVEELRNQLLALANTEVDGVHIFGGYATDQDPFDSSGATTGDISGVRRILAAPGQTAECGVSGAEAFTAAGGRDVLGDLQALATALSSNDQAAIQTSAEVCQRDQAQVVAARAKVGVQTVGLQSLNQTMLDRQLQLHTQRGRVADADTVETLTALAQAQSALNAAIQVSAQMLSRLTLVDRL